MLYSCRDIFDEKCREKETWINIGKNKQEKAGSQPHDATSHCQFTYKTLTFYLKQLLRNLLQKFRVLTAWRERKVNKYKEEQIEQSRFSIPPYNLSLLFCIPNMNILCYTVVEISLAKKCREKEKWINIEKNKLEKAGSQSHDATSHFQFTYKTLTFYIKQLLRNLLRKITVLIAW